MTMAERRAGNSVRSRERIEALEQELAECRRRLRESEERFRQLADNLEDAVWIRARSTTPDAQFPLVYVNPAFERIFGVDPGETYRSDSPWVRVLHPADRERVVNALTAFLSGSARTYNEQYRITRPSGAERWVWARAVPVHDAQGRLQRVIGLTQDITARKEAESQRDASLEALAVERNLLRTLIDALPDAIYLKDSDGRFVISNVAIASMKGMSPDDLVGRTAFDLDPPELAESYRTDDLRVMQSRQILVNREEPILDSTGKARWFSTTKVPHCDAHGNVVGLIGISRDVTEWREAAEQREEQLRFEQLLASISTGFVRLSGSEIGDQIRYGLEQMGAYLAMDRITLILALPNGDLRVAYRWAADNFEPLSPEASAAQYPRAAAVMHDGEVLMFSHLDELREDSQMDRRMFEASGVKSHLAIPLQAAGSLLGILALSCLRAERVWSPALVQRVMLLAQVFANALARRRADEALQESEQRLRTMADFTYDWEYWSGPDRRFLYISPSCERITSYRRDEFEQDPDLLNRIVHPDDRATFAEHRRTSEVEHQVHSLEMRIVARTGEVRWIAHVCQAVYGDDGAFLGWRASNRDITDHKRAEQEGQKLQAQLLQAQKMEAVGRLTAGIAHDFNNLLTVINGFAELLKMQLPADDGAIACADKIIAAGQRAASLVSKLMAFSRKQMLQPRVLDLNEVVVSMNAMLHRLISEDIILETVLAPDLWPVKVDAPQIEQVIVNLAVNARDAMPAGGRLVVETANVTVADERGSSGEMMPAGDYVRLTVTDTGSGISKEAMEHLFEPFFTTKPLGQGTGLGLATVYGIVRQSEGYIEITSAVGHGTTVTIHLPRAHAADQSPEHLPPPSLAPHGVETVLVVEDDAAVRQLACDVLSRHGYRVLQAANAQDALREAGAHAGPIHLLLSDVVMPGMSGRELAVQLAARRPGIKVILMSGYTGGMLAGYDALAPWTECVQKPISALELARKVRRALDARSPNRRSDTTDT
jgi:two-component system cell cycle sensor histidine kinase/response regulator CckA